MTAPEVYILTGPVRSGKTTSLIRWAEIKTVHGIFTPVTEGRRVFMDAGSNEQFTMEAPADEVNILAIGRFRFSKTGFDKAVQTIRDAIQKEGWLIIDEIGPLELRGEGFSAVLKEALTKRKDKILLVVREGLTGKVREHFGFAANEISADTLLSLQ